MVLDLIEEAEKVVVPIVDNVRKNSRANVYYCLEILVETGRLACKMNRFYKGEKILKKVIKVNTMYRLCMYVPPKINVVCMAFSMYLSCTYA